MLQMAASMSGWINLAFETGLVSGSGNGCFYPDDKVSQVEAAAIILRYAGVPTALNAWPKDYKTAAVSTGLTEGFSFHPDQDATEDMVRQMIHNAATMKGKPFVGFPGRVMTRLYQIPYNCSPLRRNSRELPQITARGGSGCRAERGDGVIVTGGAGCKPRSVWRGAQPSAGG